MNAMHITASVFINDDEYGLHQDYEKWLEGLAPHAPISQYQHNRTGEACPERSRGNNGDAHVNSRAIMVHRLSPRLAQACSPKPVHRVSPKVVHSCSPILVHEGASTIPPTRAYLSFRNEWEGEDRCLARGRRPWTFERS